MSHTWKPGQQQELAKRCELHPSYLCDVLRGRKRATPENATLISNEARQMGLSLDRMDLIYPHESMNPLIKVVRPEAEEGGEE